MNSVGKGYNKGRISNAQSTANDPCPDTTKRVRDRMPAFARQRSDAQPLTREAPMTIE